MVDKYHEGHLLARILSTQLNVKLLDHALAPGRGPQIQWLTSKNYTEGIAEDTRIAFEAEIEKGLNKWQEALNDAKDKVGPLPFGFDKAGPSSLTDR